MGIEREFLGWKQPPLETGLAWLLQRARRLGPSLDMAGVAVCVPSGRAGRMLVNLLVHEAERRGGSLIPPQVFTPGTLTSTLLAASSSGGNRALAPLMRRLAWRKALDELGPEARLALGGDADTDETEPLAIAALVDRSHGRLVSQLGTFASSLAAGAGVHGGTLEPRLRALADAEEHYRHVLEGAGLCDLELWFARATGLREDVSLKSLPFEQLVLLGAADMTPALRSLVRLVGADARVTVSALVCAPKEAAEKFDQIGGLVIDAWTPGAIDLGKAKFVVVDSADDLVNTALGVVGDIGRLPERPSIDDVVLGVTDPAIEPALVRAASRCGLRVRPGSGRGVLGSPAGVLLAQTRDFLREPTFRSWGTLLRHGWFGVAVAGLGEYAEGVPIDRLDRYVLTHLPDRVSSDWVADPDSDVLSSLLKHTTNLLGSLAPPINRGQEAPKKPLSSWATDIQRLLAETWSAAHHDEQARSHKVPALDSVLSGIEQMSDLARVPKLDRVVSGESAISVLLTLLQDSVATPEELEGAVEAVGWLELTMDPARHMVVLGMNDGLVPSREAPDPLLPPPVLRAMGADAGDARVARDSYYLSLLGASRSSLSIVTSRHGVDGDPLLPSRLLFRTEDSVLAARARQWLPQRHGVSVSVPMPPARATAAASRFKPLRIAKLGVPERWRVTAFKDYLQSPYLFYLRHVARVTELDEESSEMLPNLFGSLVHDCLRDFSMSAERDSKDANEIFRCVRASLSRRVGVLFGDSPAIPVWLQSEQALARLDGFSVYQSGRAKDGWTIAHAEWSPGNNGVAFTWKGGEVRLTGRIDRIDRHPSLGIALIDYKTADTAKKPTQTHQKKGDWIDLQLPLYRHLAKSVLGDHASPTLAYLNLAADGRATLEISAWDEAELHGADEKAREVIALVHAGVFGEAGTMPPTSRTFGALAGLGHLGELDDDEEDGA